MKILALTTDFVPGSGGVAVFLRSIFAELGELGHAIDVIVPEDKAGEGAACGYKYNVKKYRRLKLFSAIWPLAKMAATYYKGRHDILFLGHVMGTHAIGAVLIKKFFGVPLVILSHGNDFSYSARTLADSMVIKQLARSADIIIANSVFTAGRIKQYGYKGRIEILNPGVGANLFHPGSDISKFSSKYNLTGKKVLLTVCRLVPKKNVASVLRAFAGVAGVFPELVYLVAGDGPERKRLEELAFKLGLAGRVFFLGRMNNSELPSLYCSADIFVLPSIEITGSGDAETFGISYIEAGACGIPVVGSRTGGVADAIVDGETGIMVDPRNIGEISSVIARLLSDGAYAKKLGENARERAVMELDWSIVGRRLEKILSSLKGSVN